jgi:hypothetical protein
MTRLAAVTIGVLCAAGALVTRQHIGAATGGGESGTPQSQRPVLVELFTSEGCSSCPPADRLLTELVADQPVRGAHVIALGEHVDYWDRLGWRDPYSSSMFSERQALYQQWVFPSSTVYTPQIVVDGTRQAIGSVGIVVRHVVSQAAQSPKGSIDISASPGTGDAVRVTIRVADPPHSAAGADVYVAVTEDGLVTKVASGENGGRTLAHTAVVRSLQKLDAAPRDQPAFSAQAEVRLRPEWNRRALHLVGFVQERGTRRILAVGEQQLLPSR